MTTIDCGLTVEDLEAMPDDGRRYELIGGAIVMTPAPDLGHQRVSRRLQDRIEAAWAAVEVFDAPVDLDLPGGQRVEPDLVVVERGRTGKRLTPPVLLVVELVSPGSIVNDRITKRGVYAEAGITHYWLIDLVAGEVVCYVLEGTDYRPVVRGRTVQTTEPVALAIDLARLSDPR